MNMIIKWVKMDKHVWEMNKLINIPVSTYKSQNFAQSRRNFAPSHDGETVTFRNSAQAKKTPEYISHSLFKHSAPQKIQVLLLTEFVLSISNVYFRYRHISICLKLPYNITLALQINMINEKGHISSLAWPGQTWRSSLLPSLLSLKASGLATDLLLTLLLTNGLKRPVDCCTILCGQ